MKKTICCVLFAFSLSLLPSSGHALTVTCVNCSTNLVQLLDRITSMEQLQNIIGQYHENIQQTAQQIRMVQQNVEQYANMIQNTVQLPANLVNGLKGNMTRLAQLSQQLKIQRGDMISLGEIFAQIFPEQDSFKGLAGASSPQEQAAAVEQYRQYWDIWSKEVDRASQATFQLSGQQLEDLQQDSNRFQSYLDDLLSTPEGQMQAAMAGNQLAAIQIQEAKQLRELVATNIQSQLQSQMKAEKQGQMMEEQWRETTRTDRIGKAQAKPDPF